MALGEGRYLARTHEDEADSVLVIRKLDVPRPRKRARKVDAGDPPTLPLTRATAVTPQKLGGPEAAADWLKAAGKDEEAQAAMVAEALKLLNRAIHAHRTATANPYLADVGDHSPAAMRVGYGSGDEVADGRWREAVELPRGGKKRRVREADAAPEGRIAAVLGGRERVDACEALILRARADLDNGRPREAALQLRVGLDAVLAEVSPTGSGEGQAEDLAGLKAQRQAVAAAADGALQGPLDARETETVAEALKLAERVLRRRTLRAG